MKRLILCLSVGSLLLGSVAAGVAGCKREDKQGVRLINVSYDPTRELYDRVNKAFIEDYKKQTGKDVSIEQSHGGSSKQARSVIDGVKADVVTLALAYDITQVEKAGLINKDWQKRLESNSSPYTSTIVFLVRKGNEKGIKDWADLIRPDVKVITPNPKTSGGARWNFLAAWGYAAGLKGTGSTELASAPEAKEDAALLNNPKSREFIAALYKNVPVLDTGARGSTVTFAQKGIGDVLIAWENEAWLAQREFGRDKFEIVYPTVSILAEPPVAVVDKVVEGKKTREAAEAYLKFLYTPAAQEIIAQEHYRPRDAALLRKYEKELPPLKLFTVAEFGGWDKAQAHFFAEKGVFDQLYQPPK